MYKVLTLKDVGQQNVEESKLKMLHMLKNIEDFCVGVLVVPGVRREKVYDVKAITEFLGVIHFTKKVKKPYYTKNKLATFLTEVEHGKPAGYYVSKKREIEEIYNVEDILKKNKLQLVSEKEFIYSRYQTFFTKEDVRIFPFSFRKKGLFELYGYKWANTLQPIYRFNPDVFQSLQLKKEEVKNTDHVCHILDIPTLKSWLKGRKMAYSRIKEVKGMIGTSYLVFDLKEKDWHQVRIKLATEPPAYERVFKKDV